MSENEKSEMVLVGQQMRQVFSTMTPYRWKMSNGADLSNLSC